MISQKKPYFSQCKTTLINGRRHTDCTRQKLGNDPRHRGDEGDPPTISIRNRLASLIDEETTVLVLADNALGPKILHGTFSALSALHSLDLSANRFTFGSYFLFLPFYFSAKVVHYDLSRHGCLC